MLVYYNITYFSLYTSEKPILKFCRVMLEHPVYICTFFYPRRYTAMCSVQNHPQAFGGDRRNRKKLPVARAFVTKSLFASHLPRRTNANFRRVFIWQKIITCETGDYDARGKFSHVRRDAAEGRGGIISAYCTGCSIMGDERGWRVANAESCPLELRKSSAMPAYCGRGTRPNACFRL